MKVSKRVLRGILLLIFSLFFAIALASFDDRDIGTFWHVHNLCGPIGSVSAFFLREVFGSVLAWFWPGLLAFFSFALFSNTEISTLRWKTVLSILMLWVVCSLVFLVFKGSAGGWLGIKTIALFQLLAGRAGAILIVAALFAAISFALFSSVLSRIVVDAGDRLSRLFRFKRRKAKRAKQRKEKAVEEPLFEEEWEQPEVTVSETAVINKQDSKKKPLRIHVQSNVKGSGIPLPVLSILDDYDESDVRYDKEELLMRSELIEQKLKDYGLEGRVREVKPGPVVTTFEFVPAPGVKVSQIASRADDISLALAARAIRIQAPIPGKGAVGIEVPNAKAKFVTLRELMEHYPVEKEGLWVALGKTVTGEPYFANIADMPHLLIAGATGSGKSVCINSIICSLLFHHSPESLRLILVDPKRLELITYNGIPHLLHPVITDAKTTLKVLRWLTEEMDRRYVLLASIGVKNIQGYNRKVTQSKLVSPETGEELKRLPYYMTIIDELADIMVMMGNEIYQPITRLAQMARAVGIHLVFATQRPSVDVVTGLIKANFPCRIAFQVTSKTDSRTILDANGAEKLLGNGDMLYLPKNQPAPLRLQGAFISETEAERVAAYWKSGSIEEVTLDLSVESRDFLSGEDQADDELFDKAKELVIFHQQGSISLIQRRLRVGYARAARLIDMLERAGIVGPFEGSKARRVLVSREEYEKNR